MALCLGLDVIIDLVCMPAVLVMPSYPALLATCISSV